MRTKDESIHSTADSTPRLGALQWVGPTLVSVATLVASFTSPPLFGGLNDRGSESLSYLQYALQNHFLLLVYAPFLVAIGAVVVGAFRALAAAPHRQEFQALMALGATRRQLLQRQWRTAAIHGALFSLGGTILGAALRQITSGSWGAIESSIAWARLITAGIGVVTMLVAYVLVAHWVTSTARQSPHTSRTPSTETHPTRAARRVPRPRWPWIAVAIIVASPLANRLWEASGYQFVGGSERPWWARLLAGTAGVLPFATWLAVPALLMLLAARIARSLAKLAGRALAEGSHGTGFRAIAADGLARQTPVRAIAMVAIATIMAGATAITMGLNATEARIDVANGLTPSAIVSTFTMDPPSFAPTTMATTRTGGTTDAPAALPDSLVSSMQSDSRLIVVPAGAIIADPGTAWEDSRKPFALMAPSARAFDAVSPGAARDLYFAPGFSWGYATSITVDGHELTMHDPFVPTPVTGVPREWVESVVGPLPTSAVLLYPAGDTSVGDVLADYDLTGLEVANGAPSGWHSDGVDPGLLASIAGPLLLLAIGLIIALAFTVQRLRAGDYATMSALGATRAALRGATATEAAVTTLIGATLGMAFGMALSAPFTLQTAHLGLTELSTVAWWNIGFNIVHAPWLALWTLALAATALAAAGSLLARARNDALTPSAQLREAIKEGAL